MGGWDFQTYYMGNFHVDVKGENPWVGDYAMDRHVNWNLSRPEYMFNWVGKSEFKRSLCLLLPYRLQDQLQLQQPAADAQRGHGGDNGWKAVWCENPQKQVQPPHRNCSLETCHNFQTEMYVGYTFCTK